MSGTPASRTGRVRMIVADDEPGFTEPLSAAVTEAGRRPRPAADGQSAPRLARAPHAVVLEGMLPDLDGIRRGRAQVIHTVRGRGHVIRDVEAGR
ncbi:hypothetical protein ACIPSA_50505 [Streptomyces sp. NPDC086549]|uniref:hypothetical protein n=1 Tax=Streptomyces sp. NPDC086549 TaxID=3365752 RepID=UPI0037FAADF7